MNKKKILGIIVLIVSSISASAQTNQTLPELNVIKEFNFATQYSCGGGYEKSALFLSEYSKDMNSPELLYNGTCQDNAYIDVNTHGGNFSLVSDLGDVPLEDVTASKTLNWSNIVGGDNSFHETTTVKLNHTYAVFYTSGDIEALYNFKIVAYDSNGPMTIRYAVKKYQINPSLEESQGFAWEIGNHH